MGIKKPVIEQIRDRKWQWIGHSLRKDPQAVERKFSTEPSGTA
jgi:hypothetical protein